jgi:hypothetical protein
MDEAPIHFQNKDTIREILLMELTMGTEFINGPMDANTEETGKTVWQMVWEWSWMPLEMSLMKAFGNAICPSRKLFPMFPIKQLDKKPRKNNHTF